MAAAKRSNVMAGVARPVRRVAERRHLPPLLFAAAAVLLFLVVRDGAALRTTLGAVAVFGLTAALWMYAEHRSDVPRSGALRGAGLVAAGAALLLCFLWFPFDGLGVVGAAAVFLGLGRLLATWRASRNGRPWRGPVILAGCALLFVVGWVGVSPGMPWWSLTALGTAVLAVPVGLNVGSEDALRALTHGARWRRLVLAGSGALLLALSLAWLLRIGAPAMITLLAAVAVAALLWAITSNNQADVLLAVIFCALLLSATPQAAPPGDPPRGEATLLALGDSYMSGEGAQVYFDGTDDFGSNQCRRAPSAYAWETASVDSTFSSVAFLACSGARTDNIHRTAQHPGEPPGTPGAGGEPSGRDQLEHLDLLRAAGDFDIELAVVSIGGNDSGFATIGATCVAPGNCNDVGHLWMGNLRRHVASEVAVTYQRIRDHLGPGVPVVVVPYPMPVDPRGCNEVWLSEGELRFIAEFLESLNDTLRQAAAKAGFWYLDEMENSLADANLRLCDRPGRPTGVNFIGVRSVKGLWEQQLNPANWVHNSLHPNEVGHDALRRTFRRWLSGHPGLRAVPATGPADDAPRLVPGEPESAEPPCTITDVSEDGCNARARNWALDQTVDLLWPGALLPIAAAGGIWLFLLGVLSMWRLRRRPDATNRS